MHCLAKVMVFNVNVPGSWTHLWRFCHLQGTCIVFKHFTVHFRLIGGGKAKSGLTQLSY
jgi:hypothetical protein